MMVSVPFEFAAGLAAQFGCVECFWRASTRLRRYRKGRITGFVAEVWFDSLPKDFAVRWSAVVGYSVQVWRRDDGYEKYAVSVPCVVPDGEVKLGLGSRGSWLILVRW